MTQSPNPYVTDGAIRGEQGLFGREDILDWVLQEMQDPSANGLLIFGQRRIGKTSLLLFLERALVSDALLPVYFDLQDQAARPLGQVLADLAGELAGRAGLEAPGPALFDDQGHFFSRTFLPRFCLAALKEHQRLVFLLDEFDAPDQAAEANLPEAAAITALFPCLRRALDEDPRPIFVFALGRRASDLDLDFDATFGVSLVQEVGPLSWESAEALVRQAEVDGTLAFSGLAVSRILNLSGCYPYPTQLLCRQIWERAYAEHPAEPPLIDMPAVDAAVPDALAAGDLTLAWVWDGLSPAEKLYAAALAGIVEEGEAAPERYVLGVLANEIPQLYALEMGRAPHDLVRWRVLEEHRDREHFFAVELFRRWVCQNKPLRDVADGLDWTSLEPGPLGEPEGEHYAGARTDLGEQAARVGAESAVGVRRGDVAVRRDSLKPVSAAYGGAVGSGMATTAARRGRQPPRRADEVEAEESIPFFVEARQLMDRLRGVLAEATWRERLSLVGFAVGIPVMSVLIFYGIGLGLVGGLSSVAWLPPLFDRPAFYRFGLVSAILGLYPGLRGSYEFIKQLEFKLELVYQWVGWFAYAILSVVLLCGLLTLLGWASQASIMAGIWEAAQTLLSILRLYRPEAQ